MPAETAPTGVTASANGAGKRGSPGVMKSPRNPRYLAWIRTQPCCVCGAKRGIEASHTGPHGIGQKSPDSSAIPLCAKHHRTGADSYHRLGRENSRRDTIWISRPSCAG